MDVEAVSEKLDNSINALSFLKDRIEMNEANLKSDINKYTAVIELVVGSLEDISKTLEENETEPSPINYSDQF